MFIKAVIFSRKERMDQGRRNIFNSHRCASFFSKFSEQFVVAGIDPQRDLQPNVLQHLNRWQPGFEPDVKDDGQNEYNDCHRKQGGEQQSHQTVKRHDGKNNL